MRFNLTVNDNHSDGFKLSVQADKPEELSIVKDLTEQLIAKITKIEVAIQQSDEY